jgi:hypothetical protein
MAVTKGPASITVTIGHSRRMTFETNSQNPISYFEMPFDSHTTGPVTLALNGRSTIGPEIGGACGEREVSTGASCPRLFYLTEPFSFLGVPECCCHSSLSFGRVERGQVRGSSDALSVVVGALDVFLAGKTGERGCVLLSTPDQMP